MGGLPKGLWADVGGEGVSTLVVSVWADMGS